MSDTTSYDDHPSHGSADEEPVALPFATVLQQLSRGAVHDDLSARFRELMAACREHQTKGKLTLTLAVKPSGDTVVLEPGVKVDHPQPAHDASFFYFDRDGNPVRDDPSQPKLPMQVAPAPPTTTHQAPRPREVRVAGRTNTE
jgi:hypothetical protein